jgi:DNA invertase Pin-like site-specific DNA recombinase
MSGRKPVAIYGRVLIDWQTTENEIFRLKETAAQRGWEVGEVYVDDAIKAANGKGKRPALDKILRDAKNQQFDTIMVGSISQIARSAQVISGFIARMAALDIDQYYQKEAIDTSTPTGKAMVQMCVDLSKVEPAPARARIAGPPSRAQGEPGRLARTKVDPQTEWAICQSLAAGKKGIQKIATDFSVPSSTVQRIKAEMSKLS